MEERIAGVAKSAGGGRIRVEDSVLELCGGGGGRGIG